VTETTKLTARVKAGGCAAKLSPKILDQVLPRVPRITDENVLVGFDTSDDAGIYRINDSLALVQTIDFFTPMVDDPFTFGAIAAANALSDVYAMGGRPLTSLSVLCWPGDRDLDDLEAVLRGGAAKMAEAGCVILGGHSVRDDEIKFGFSVTGTVKPDRIWANRGAVPGDTLYFTKRIGTGVISTALKQGIARDSDVDAAVTQMLTLNKAVAESLEIAEIHACTDVTGFGLIAHAREIAMASGVTLEIDAEAVPLLDGALEYAAAGAQPGGLKNNREFAESCVEYTRELDEALNALLFDPQTSGGLLISTTDPVPFAYPIGRVIERSAKPIRIL
jgi:selenide,water dikinase